MTNHLNQDLLRIRNFIIIITGILFIVGLLWIIDKYIYSTVTVSTETVIVPVNNSQLQISNIELPVKTIKLNITNTVSYYGIVTNSSVAIITNTLLEKYIKYKPSVMYLVVHNFGGDVQAGMNLIEYLKGFHVPVYVINVFGASMAFHLLQYSPERYITRMGILMSHQAFGGEEGTLPGSLNTRVNFWTTIINTLDYNAAKRAGLTLEEYYKKIQNEYWCFGTQCLLEKFVDAIVDIQCDSTLIGTQQTPILDINTPFGVMTLIAESNKCPLPAAPKTLIIKDNNTNNLVSLSSVWIYIPELMKTYIKIFFKKDLE